MIESLAAALVLWTFRVFRVLRGGVRVLLEGFWLGVLPESAVDLVTERSYRSGSEYTNRLTLNRASIFGRNWRLAAFFLPAAKSWWRRRAEVANCLH
ncbi:MAG: hypothetical protein ABSB15_06935 [Bryobacteraceae bacterium]|jgi:hypothetical protein